jgi:hypothetical protein
MTKKPSYSRHHKGQAILEYILLVVMLAVTVAVTIRNTNRTIYQLWTGVAVQVSKGCAHCTPEAGAPQLP